MGALHRRHARDAGHRTARAARRRLPAHRHAQRRDRDALVSRSEEHTSELQSLMRISYAVFCLKKKIIIKNKSHGNHQKLKKYNTHEMDKNQDKCRIISLSP